MNIIMTGATSGFGLEAATHLIAGGHKLTVGARSPESAPRLLKEKTAIKPLDLDSLASVRTFAASMDAAPIDGLILNAGLQLAQPAKSADGFERTFAVNHLAHFLLLNLLQDRLTSGARVIITGSGTHDPEEKTPVTPPAHANADWLAFPEKDPHRPKARMTANFRAYSSSKLANVMTVREMTRRMPDVTSLCFDPGYVPGTRLARENPAAIAWLAGKIIPLLMKNGRASSVERSGGFLAALAQEPAYAASRGAYWSVRGTALKNLPPSALARDDAACAKLWDDSARLTGL